MTAITSRTRQSTRERRQRVCHAQVVAALACEFALIFFAAPTLFVSTRHRIPAIPALWVLTAYCLFVLLREPHFERTRLWNAAGLAQHAPAILGLFGVALAAGILLVRRYAPAAFLSFPRTNPVFWGLVMVLYPVLSVYPQGIAYRLFLFERYRVLFGSG